MSKIESRLCYASKRWFWSGFSWQLGNPAYKAAMQVYTDDELRSLSFTTKDEDAAQRLDTTLVKYATTTPRAACRSAIEAGRVTIEGMTGATLKPSFKVKAGMVISAQLPSPKEVALAASDVSHAEVLFQDDQIIVFNKPAGMATHPQRVDDLSSLASVVLAHCPSAPPADGKELRPGIVHRLDTDTTGAIVCAKTEAAMANLKDQFRARGVEKRYLAVVHGVPEKLEMTIDTPIAPDPTRRTMMRLDKAKGKPAVTVVRGIERFAGYALEEAIPQSGRTHQIRVHLQARGFPILADYLYSKSAEITMRDIAPSTDSDEVVIARQALHAARLSFDHPTSGERLIFEAPLPSDFLTLLEVLREYAPWQAPKGE